MHLIREARLKGQFEELYPEVPARIWILASRLVRLAHDGPHGYYHADRSRERMRLGQHFEFRGGLPRGPRWSGILTRGGDPWVYETD